MELAYYRLKLRTTRYLVEFARTFCDGCNVGINYIAKPVIKITNRLSSHGEWFILLMCSTVLLYVPITVKPYLLAESNKSTREEQEEERVRLCLQKGIDPFPYLAFREYNRGHVVASGLTEEEFPPNIAWQERAQTQYEELKEELRREVGGSVDDSVSKMLKMRERQRRERNKLNEKHNNA